MIGKNFFRMLEEAEYLKDDSNNIFDELYVIQNIEKHDSGYHFITILGKRDKEEKLYILSKCSDVIHFEKVSEYSWFMSMDIPYYGIIRLFPRRNYKFLIPFTSISDFTVEFVGDTHGNSNN